ncbi:MAG: WcaI family glycosyltransferase [Alphaproteobacteria bacterium]|nr:WcaI family glycosyltransferase [Alphaproteobacteria bacterium]MBU2380734.1 WcaI family glycosyltransferase [Alphaproteobacteria bacterium]
MSLKVLIIALNYAPELVGCAKYTTELAEDLVVRGHRVEVVCGPPYYPQWKVADGFSGGRWTREVRNGVTLHRTPLYVPARPSGARRVAHLASFGLAATPSAVAAALRLRPDVVLAIAPTVAAAGAALLAARVCGAASWLHVQDFEVDAAFDLGLLDKGMGRQAALGLERRVLKGFDRVSSISGAMVALLDRKGVPVDRTMELRNWVDVDAVAMAATSDSAYRRQLHIAPDRIVALYSGNMAAKQGIEMLGGVVARVAAAGAPVSFLFCGEGPARTTLEAACAGRDDVHFLPLQPMERLSELLGTADIHLLPQRPEAADLVLPSKLTGMLASGRPVVAMAAPGSGLAAEVEGCGALCDATGEAMAAAVLGLAEDTDARRTLGRNARLRAEQRWRKSMIIDGFEAQLQALR